MFIFVFHHLTKWNVEILLNFEHGYFWKQLSRNWPGSPTSWGTQPDTFLWQFLPFIMVSMTWLSASFTLCAEGWRKKESNQNYRNGFWSSNCYYKSSLPRRRSYGFATQSFLSHVRTRDEPLRTFAWEATTRVNEDGIKILFNCPRRDLTQKAKSRGGTPVTHAHINEST